MTKNLSLSLIWVLISFLASTAQGVSYLKTESGKDFYIVSVEMNVRKSYHDLSFPPYPDKLGDNRLTRRKMSAVIPYNDSKLESIMMFDTYKGAKRAYIEDDKPYKNTTHKGLKNPSGHEAAIYLVKSEKEQIRIDLFLGNWKHNWNRFNQLEIVYSVPESQNKDKLGTVIVSPQMPSTEIIFGPIPFFSF